MGLELLSAYRSAQTFNDDAERILGVPTTTSEEMIRKLELLKVLAKSVVDDCRHVLPAGEAAKAFRRWSNGPDRAAM